MNGPRPLRALLGAWSPAAMRAKESDEAALLANVWPEAVGPDVARRTRAGKYRDGTLAVFTAGSAWSHQLTFLAPTIIERLRERVKGVPLQRLRFVVATGRTRVLLDRDAGASGQRSLRAGRREEKTSNAAGPSDGASLSEIFEGLKREQAALDARRTAGGWRRCERCGVWRPTRRCPPCDQSARRRSDGRIARIVRAAPWQSGDELVRALDGTTKAAIERVRRRLRLDWERHLHDARWRLRRDTLESGDRIAAWSLAMLVTGRQQSDIARPVVEATLGREWAAVLCDESARTSKKVR